MRRSDNKLKKEKKRKKKFFYYNLFMGLKNQFYTVYDRVEYAFIFIFNEFREKKSVYVYFLPLSDGV